jgi:hypothetical protein
MRSRLETRAATYLDVMGIPWAYEPQTFFGFRDRRRAGYLPDFQLWPHNPNGLWYLEVKPISLWSPSRSDPLRVAIEKMGLIRDTHLHAVLALWMVEPRSITKGTVLVSEPGLPWKAYFASGWLGQAERLRAREYVPSQPLWRRLTRWLRP